MWPEACHYRQIPELNQSVQSPLFSFFDFLAFLHLNMVSWVMILLILINTIVSYSYTDCESMQAARDVHTLSLYYFFCVS